MKKEKPSSRKPLKDPKEKMRQSESSEVWAKCGIKGEEERQKVSRRTIEESFTEADVARLLEEAEGAAFGTEGSNQDAAPGSSHDKFHNLLQDLIRQNQQAVFESHNLGELGSFLGQVLQMSGEDHGCRPQPKAGSRSLYPLPVHACPEDCSRKPFLQTLLGALNSLHGVPCNPSKGANKTSMRALKRLQRIVEDAELLKEPLPKLNFHEFFSQRKLDYSGEEVKVAKGIKWESVSLSFPEEVGRLKLIDFVEGGVRHFVEHIDDYLLDPHDQEIGKTPKVFVDPAEWPTVCRGLVERGLCTIMKESQLFHVNQKPLLNGMFSVSKNEFKGNIEVTRLIMNLKPWNRNSRSLVADTGTLPSVTSLGALFLNEEENLCICSEDIRCFFYLFETPEAWWRFMGFGLAVPSEVVPHDLQGEVCYLCSKVLPMGYLNSVGIAQHVHRVVVRRCMGELNPPIGAESEMRRDRPFSQNNNLFRVYLDNYDQLRKVNKDLASVIEGSTTTEVDELRKMYEEKGLPRHPKKSVQSQFQGEIQGAWVDGIKGEVSAKASKVMKYVALILELLSRGKASQRELQVIGGGLVYVAMFKRALLCCLNQLWKTIVDMEGLPTGARRPLRKDVVHELVRFVSLLPLATMNLRNKFDALVTASDASTSGGGICVSRGLTPYGMSAALSSVRGDILEAHDFSQILSIGLFDGIGALRVALDLLQLPVAGHVSVDINEHARRVVEAWFPDTIFLDDIHEVTEEQVKSWSLKFCLVALVLIGAGPPCQGVSGLNWDRKGALRDGRSVLFQHVPRVVNLCRKFFPWAQIHFLGENVASMDFEDCTTMNEGYGCRPWYVDCDGISPCHRPRLYWCSWELVESEGSELWLGSDGRLPLQGEAKLRALFDKSAFCEQGWELPEGRSLPTFTTSRPSPHPLRRPAGLKTCRDHETLRWREDEHRFPPYQYKDENCLTNRKGEFRPPTISEREAMLGFPIGFTKQCMSKAFHDTVSHRDCRLTLLGNTWSVGVIAWLILSLVHVLGFCEDLSVQEIVDRLTPGKAQNLHSLLLRPPFQRSTRTFEVSELLVQKLAGLVSIKGEDILIQGYSDVPTRYQRLRASIPSGLWRWRTITGWKWAGNPEHINALELRSVLTTIKWRVEQQEQCDLRCAHLVDSLVVLHALSRGRSSSRKLRRTMMKICSYLLATGLQPIWAYVDTKTNPADRPSRFHIKKKWLKKV